MENRKAEAFNLLDDAEILMKENQYDRAIEYYHNAEIILNEIQFPTSSIREMREKVAFIQKKKLMISKQNYRGLKKKRISNKKSH